MRHVNAARPNQKRLAPRSPKRRNVRRVCHHRRRDAVYRAQVENSGKPANVIDKIVEGKLGSFYGQSVLPEQPTVRDPKVTVKQMLDTASKSLGGTLAVPAFLRFKVGESQ